MNHSSRETRIFGPSRWIWPVSHHWDIVNSYALFRKTFDLEVVPRKAPLFLTADQSYRLFVNGHWVGRGPARGFQASWPYDEIDVAPYLRQGSNLLAVRAYNPGTSTFQYLTCGYAGLLVAARWGTVRIASDRSWKAIRQESVRRDTVPASLQLFGQEHIDLRKEEGDWTQSGFDDSLWKAPADHPWNGGPWFSLEPRGTPLLEEKEIPSGRLIGIGAGVSASGYEAVRDVVALRHREDRSHRPANADGSRLRVEETPTGQFRSYLIDFGRTVVGNFSFEIAGARGGEIVDTHYAETIDAATLTPDLAIPTHCRIAVGDRLVCRQGRAVHTFHHHYGFRYVNVTVREAAAGLRLRPRFHGIGYPLRRRGSFSSSDPGLERIWETCAWTQQCCSLDAYVDTPFREQAQWWGDARVQAWNTFHLDGDARLFRRGIAQIAAQTTPDGVTYGHAPTMAHGCVLPDFTLIWLLTLWDYYWQTGSTEPLRTHHATVQRALGYFREWTDPRTGLLRYDERFWLFLDWAEIERKGSSSVYNLWLLIALEKLALLYRRAGLPAEAGPLEEWAGRGRAALGRLVGRDGLLRDGLTPKGKIAPGTGIHAQTLALAARLEGVDGKAALEGVLLPFVRRMELSKSTPSAFWLTYLFGLLVERGHGAEIVPFIGKFWLPMAEHGTTWENFSPKRGHESFSHAWSAHPLYHLMQTVGGIVQAAPAWKKIIFRPVFHGTHGGAVVPSPQGPIISRWRRKGASIQVRLDLPPGTTARVHLPGLRPEQAAGKQRWTVAA